MGVADDVGGLRHDDSPHHEGLHLRKDPVDPLLRIDNLEDER